MGRNARLGFCLTGPRRAAALPDAASLIFAVTVSTSPRPFRGPDRLSSVLPASARTDGFLAVLEARFAAFFTPLVTRATGLFFRAASWPSFSSPSFSSQSSCARRSSSRPLSCGRVRCCHTFRVPFRLAMGSLTVHVPLRVRTNARLCTSDRGKRKAAEAVAFRRSPRPRMNRRISYDRAS